VFGVFLLIARRKVSLFALGILLRAASPTSAADLGQIQGDLSKIWRDGQPARNFRVKCIFSLQVEHLDPALGDSFVPNTTIRGRMEPLTRWESDTARKDRKYRQDFLNYPPGQERRPSNWRGSRISNGEKSWVYTPETGNAQQHQQSSVFTRPTQDYYGDMIGFPIQPVGVKRLTAGDIKEPFQLNGLIPTGKYMLGGEETVNGETCVVLERAGLDRLDLATAKGWAIVRREWNWTMNGPLKRRITNRDFREVAPGTWLPFDAQMEIYGHPSSKPGRRVGVLRGKVVEAQVDIADNWFEPRFPKKTVIRTEEGGILLVGMKKEDLKGTLARFAQFVPAAQAAPWWRMPWVWGCALAVSLCLLGLALGTGRVRIWFLSLWR